MLCEIRVVGCVCVCEEKMSDGCQLFFSCVFCEVKKLVHTTRYNDDDSYKLYVSLRKAVIFCSWNERGTLTFSVEVAVTLIKKRPKEED